MHESNYQRQTGGVDPFAVSAEQDPAKVSEATSSVPHSGRRDPIILHLGLDSVPYDPLAARLTDCVQRPEVGPPTRSYKMSGEQLQRFQKAAEEAGVDLATYLRQREAGER